MMTLAAGAVADVDPGVAAAFATFTAGMESKTPIEQARCLQTLTHLTVVLAAFTLAPVLLLQSQT